MKVSYEPPKEIIIHEILAYDNSVNLVSTLTMGMSNRHLPPIHWANGVVSAFSTIPLTESMSKELLDGKIHWSHVSCANMTGYQPIISSAESSESKIHVINQNSNLTMSEVARFLKENALPK